MDHYAYTFPAIKGTQAKENYYICMVPLGLLPRLFPSDNEFVEPEYRAQRKLNVSRIPEIRDYILSNRTSYVFSALCASFDGDYEFTSLGTYPSLGTLSISMDASMLINDGQHRRAAIIEAINEDPSLKEENIPVVMFLDKGLTRSQQMFTDLNKHAINTTKSLNALYDSNDPLSMMTKTVVYSVPFFKRYTDKEKDNLGKYSSNLFTLNNIVNANKLLTKGRQINKETENFAVSFWERVCQEILEFKELESKTISKVELRENYIITQGVTINALGLLGNYLLKTGTPLDTLQKLSRIDWKRSNSIWQGKAINSKGRIVKNNPAVNLTYFEIKRQIDLRLSKEEKIMLKDLKVE